MHLPSPESEKSFKRINDYHQLEINEIFVRTRSLTSIRFQLFSFIGTAHLTIIGIAFTIEKVILIYVASSLMLLLIRLDAVIESIIEALVVRGLQLELMYTPDTEPLWASILAAVSRRYPEPRVLTLNIDAASPQAEILQKIQVRSTKRLGLWLPMTVLTIEILGGTLLWVWGVLPLF